MSEKTKFILGEKMEMSQIFDEDGRVIPVTLIKVGPMVIIQIKTKDKDGYEGVKVGFGSRNPKNIKKPQLSQIRKATDLNPKYLREFRTAPGAEISDFNVGDIIDASILEEGDTVKIKGISKGKGFQGVVKRYGFKGGSRTHGQKHSEREPGSIGSTWPQRVIKGKRMPGRMGGDKVTVRNLKVVKMDKERGLLAVSGAVPGRRGTLVEIRSLH